MLFIALFISCMCIFIGKAISDTTSDETNWHKSIFKNLGAINSFWGAKNKTYKRKDNDNLILNYLLHTILVFTTDIWHLGNTIRRLGIYMSLFVSLLLGGNTDLSIIHVMIIIGTFILTNVIGFHIMYHYILKKDAKF